MGVPSCKMPGECGPNPEMKPKEVLGPPPPSTDKTVGWNPESYEVVGKQRGPAVAGPHGLVMVYELSRPIP